MTVRPGSAEVRAGGLSGGDVDGAAEGGARSSRRGGGIGEPGLEA